MALCFINLYYCFFHHLMRRADSLENTLILGGIGGRRTGGRGQQGCSVQEVCMASNIAWSSGVEVGDGGDSIKRYLRKKSDSL